MKNSYMLKVTRVGEPAPLMMVDSPKIALRYWRKVVEKQPIFDPEKEHLVVLLLDTKYFIKGYSIVGIGSVNECIGGPREVFRPAVASAAFAILLMHNHPSGDPTPGERDKRHMEKIRAGGAILDIKLLDYVIVGRARKYFSFLEAEEARADEDYVEVAIEVED